MNHFCDFEARNPVAFMAAFEALVVCDVDFEYHVSDYYKDFGLESYVRAYCSRKELLDILYSELNPEDITQIITLNNR